MKFLYAIIPEEYRWIVPIISFAIVLIGVVSFALSSLNNVYQVKNSALEFENWYEQLPQSHWVKQKNDEYFAFLGMLKLKTSLEQSVKPVFNLAEDTAKQKMGIYGDALFALAEHEAKTNSPKYMLSSESKKDVNKIKMKQNEILKFSLTRNQENLLFDVNEKDFLSGKYFVISYIENPEVAKIFNGEIIALSKGKTNLVICDGKNRLTYPISVRN